MSPREQLCAGRADQASEEMRNNWLLILRFNEKRTIGWFGLSEVIVSGGLQARAGTLCPESLLSTAKLQAAGWFFMFMKYMTHNKVT